MPYFAYVLGGLVQKVERIEGWVMEDDDGVELEPLGQAYLANLYPGTTAADYVMTHYPHNQPDPYPRGCFAGIGFTWDGSTFAPPQT